jgi:hypothetical protein
MGYFELAESIGFSGGMFVANEQSVHINNDRFGTYIESSVTYSCSEECKFGCRRPASCNLCAN